MNKQQLANKIWESANKMRSKIEANEYKDYILGFIFYKYLSDKEIEYLKKNDWTDEDLPELVEEDEDIVKQCQKNIGYFIAYDNLFSTWLAQGNKFDVSNVTDALSAFARLINSTHKNVFDKIFDTLQTGLTKLGETSGARTKAIRGLITLIKDIPMDERQGYDVLGFIYEYLISNFAANAGKKAGEFYTPHEVSLLMSEIVANHLRDRQNIAIYDPTSGSGSLLINIGHSAAKYMDKEKIQYYAQELKENTYNLTRMNLVMRGIKPSSIFTRNADTLEDDWPIDVEKYPPVLRVDAVVSNPPYSQHWTPDGKSGDPRYAGYGIAPKSKADYAFLLHDLYHVLPDGIMTIVLPHGVLFRGGEEAEIRKNLIENNKIDAIIGLPANIFFGTNIPTIIMVLKQNRDNNDVLIIDASKCFEKSGKNNHLRASDIKKIADTVIQRLDVPKFSRKVSRSDIRENGYNLNIPRYVDSSDAPESWDIYASMFGGIPVAEIESLSEYWTAFSGLREALFTPQNDTYMTMATDNVPDAIKSHDSVIQWKDSYTSAFSGFDEWLYAQLVEGAMSLNVPQEETAISDVIFDRLKPIALVEKYSAYQILDDHWIGISADLEMMQTEGFETVKRVDPRMVIKKVEGKDAEVQDGWVGRIIPFELVQRTMLKDELLEVQRREERIGDIETELTEIIDSLSEDYTNGSDSITNDDNTAFDKTNLSKKVSEILQDVVSPEISALQEYLTISKKSDKTDFIESHENVNWYAMQPSKDGTYSKTVVNKYIKALQMKYEFPENSAERCITAAVMLLDEVKEIKREVKEMKAQLDVHTKETIEALSAEQTKDLLRQKWIAPLCTELKEMQSIIIEQICTRVKALSEKYAETYSSISEQADDTSSAIKGYIHELRGSDFDMQGLKEFERLLGGNPDEE